MGKLDTVSELMEHSPPPSPYSSTTGGVISQGGGIVGSLFVLVTKSGGEAGGIRWELKYEDHPWKQFRKRQYFEMMETMNI